MVSTNVKNARHFPVFTGDIISKHAPPPYPEICGKCSCISGSPDLFRYCSSGSFTGITFGVDIDSIN